MSRVVDYSVLFGDHTPHLRLAYDPRELHPWRMLDTRRADQLYAHAPTLTQAVRFMRAQARKGDATVDEVSITVYATWADPWADIASGEPTGESALGRGRFPASEPLVPQADLDTQVEPASPDDFSRKVTAQVLPFRRPAEPLDEVAG